MLLFTPGPTPVPESVRLAMAEPTLHHRTPEFEAIFKETRELLFELMETDEVIMLASTGTGAMEAAVVNLCHNTLLNVNSGKFGERFGKIAKAHGLHNVEIKHEWDTPATVEEIIKVVKTNEQIDAIAIQISESAGGLRHPVEEIAKAIKEIRPDVMVIADGITAVGVERIDTTHIDVLIAGSQKALMLPPGLAILGMSNAAIKKIGEGKGYYFNLTSEIKKQQQNTTAYTAATTLVIGLGKILKEIKKDDGLGKLYCDTARRAKATRFALEALGLHSYPKIPARSMTTIDDKNAKEIRDLLKTDFGVNVAGGQDHLKGKIFRINQMGLIKPYEMVWVVNAVELVLAKLGRRPYDGTASKVFSEEYFKNILKSENT
ncbi:MAG: alanine--glyoxylate aminotransferase family protein [Sulfurovum sp.]|nr:alanine--glyoxylate aminotransferase family protein [Sulfurovum sp.]MCB4744130.1 alanine--glyoxylate aminotransferase family protein [Sulfurovum sp.]MCB4749678.1 alanine--glyoxylate aminotransferase family protein [Sulfurovum sp.]MCB4751865.1 alanine--glyoxylate aminotransferase family protein [Sulfurovum sp.]MCB4753415.1 alanine--glyoxylate aminotransferase family protein [Sulfurovum sp.]